MQAGKLRHRIEIQEERQTRSERGGIIPEWSTIRSVWGEAVDLTGRELMMAGQAQSIATVRVRMRYWADITNRHRLVCGDRRLQIVNVADPDGRTAEMVLLCADVKEES